MQRTAVLLMVILPGIWCTAVAQPCTLRGRVVDADTGAPLEFVNVFLTGTTSGTSTDTKGSFELSNVPAGEYTIVASRVGYHREPRVISLEPAGVLDLTFRIQPRQLQTDEVQVLSTDRSEWRRLLALFTKAFLGQTDNARGCTIRNPYRLDLWFDESGSTLTARCDSPLIVENRSLGYVVSIEIDQFEWDSRHERVRYSLYTRFSDLEPTERDSAEWAENRESTYRGSLKHFLKSAVTGRLSEENFLLRSGSVNVLLDSGGDFFSPDELNITPDGTPGVYRMSFREWIRVDYRQAVPGIRNLLKLHAPYVRVDRDGNLLTRYGLEKGGTWSNSGIADLLPMH